MFMQKTRPLFVVTYPSLLEMLPSIHFESEIHAPWAALTLTLSHGERESSAPFL